MKTIYSGWIATLLLTFISLSGCSRETQENPRSQCQATEEIVCITLPPVATVELKDGNKKAGQLAAINEGDKNIALESNGISEVVAMADIEKLTFTEEDIPKGEIGTIRDGEEIWSVKPITELPLNATGEGAELKREAVKKLLNPSKTEADFYAIEEIEFKLDSSEITRLTVIPKQS